MSGGAPKEVFALLAPKFEQQTGNKVKFTYAVITELREKLGAGEKADVLVLPTPVLDSLANDGKVRADSRATFGTVGISVAVREGAPQRDISSKEKFRDAMLAARSVVHATPGKGHPQASARRRRAVGGGRPGRHRHLSGERSRGHQRFDYRRALAGGYQP